MMKDISEIIDELNKLNVDINHQNDLLNDILREFEELQRDLEQFLDKSKNYQLEEAERQWKIMHGKLADAEKQMAVDDSKLAVYVQKIKDGVRQNMGEDDIINELKKLKADADAIEVDLRKAASKVNNMNS